jgi:murein DD-endopeptidase MepM/ murein hydrolase activator NlpD
MKANFYNRGQGFIGIIIALVVVGLITVGLYYYLQKQIPEIPEITKKPTEEKIIKPGETTPPPKELPKEEIALEKKVEKETLEKSSPQIYFSSNKLEQGDTLLIKIGGKSAINEVGGEFGPVKINFFKPVTAKNWIAIVGIDARKKPGEYDLVINFPNGHKIKKEIDIVERKFPVTELLVTKELEEKGFTPSKIVENIVSKENLIVGEILSIYTPKAYFNKAFTNPLKEIKAVGAFGNIRKSGDVGIQHLGVDLEADIGTPVYAINNGVVSFSQELTTYGKTLIINHGLGIFSLYLHLDEFKVGEGNQVAQGEIIGFSGNTGYSIAPPFTFLDEG